MRSPGQEGERRRQQRSIAIALTLGAVVLLIYVAAFVKIAGIARP